MERKAKADYALLSVLAGALVVGYCLYLLLAAPGCRMFEGAARDLKEAAPWLPAPWGATAEIGSTILLMLVGNKVRRHVRKRRRAKRSTPAHAPR